MTLLFRPTTSFAQHDAGNAATTTSQQSWQPAVDIVETATAFHMSADIPGVATNSVDIEVLEDTLVLRGERVTRNSEADTRGDRYERPSGEFIRRFKLPDSADTEQISARSEHGVLDITIPKKADAGPRKIAIQ